MDADTPPSKPPASSSERLFDAFPPVSTEAWTRAVEEDLDAALDTLTWSAPGGLSVRLFYRAEDLDALQHMARPLLIEAPWRIRHNVGAPDLKTANRHARAALEGGAQDLGLDLGCQRGQMRGLPVQSPGDLGAVLDGIDLSATPLHLRGGRAALPLLAMLLETADRRGVDGATLRGSLDLDPVGVLLREEAPNPARAFDDAAAALREAGETGLRLLMASAAPAHHAGATQVQELAFALAAASEHLAQATERGLAPARIAEMLHVELPIGTSYFLEIAKLRALRLLWPQVYAAFAECAAQDAPAAFVQALTSRRAQTLYDPHMNLLRGTTAAAAAILGGCDVLAVRPFDAPSGAPSAFAQRLARSTQLILQHEAHFGHVADPSAGAYTIEALTDQIARSAWSLFQEIEAEGGLLAALHSGFVQQKIAEARAERQRAFATRGRVLVGTNHYPNPDETRLDSAEAGGGTALRSAGRSFAPDPAAPLEALRRAFAEGAALGDVLAPTETSSTSGAEPLPKIRDAEPFEALRLRTERWAEARGARPLVYLLPVGDPSVRSARATFARNVFGCAGFHIEEPLGFDDVGEAAEAAAGSDAAIAVLCSRDEAYADLTPRLRKRLAQMDDAPLLVIAGPSNDALDADGFVHRGMNVLEALENYQKQLGFHPADAGKAFQHPTSNIQH